MEEKKTTLRLGQAYQIRAAELAELTGLSQAQLVRIGLDKIATEMGLKPIAKFVPNLEASSREMARRN